MNIFESKDTIVYSFIYNSVFYLKINFVKFLNNEKASIYADLQINRYKVNSKKI